VSGFLRRCRGARSAAPLSGLFPAVAATPGQKKKPSAILFERTRATTNQRFTRCRQKMNSEKSLRENDREYLAEIRRKLYLAMSIM
jgi:hypothetical protein